MNGETKLHLKDVMRAARPHLLALAYVLLILLSCLGICISESGNLMYNTLIMPIVGILGYCVFGWKAIYKLPIVMIFISLFAYATRLTELDFYSTLIWSLIYLLLAISGFSAAFLFVYGCKKAENKNKVLRVISLVLAILLSGALCVFANGLVGNPISKALATSTAKKHLDENYKGSDFVVESVSYDFKSGNYYAHISSPSSIDSFFGLDLDMGGKLIYDSYKDQVTSKRNTAHRVGWAYREAVGNILDSKAFPYEAHIAFGELIFYENDYVDEAPDYAIKTEGMKLDAFYDINELGAKAGSLTVYIYDDTVTVERLSTILLGIKETFDDAGVKFHVISCVLEYPRNEDGTAKDGRVEVMDFIYSDIYEDGLVERVEASNTAAKEYYATEDAKKI